MPQWLRLAFTGPCIKRALKYAVVVGAILIAINHGDAIIRGELTGVQYVKMGLTVMVPYCVSALSSVGAMLQMRASEQTG